MENGLQAFANPAFGEIRVTMIDGEPWFVAADVCKALEIKNSRDALARLDDDEKGVDLIYTPGGKQEMNIVNEPGLYGLVLGSRKKEARDFKRWIKHEVLPAIRKTGGYIAGADKMTDAEIMARAVLVANRTIEARDARIRELEAKAKADAPKVIFAGAVSVSNDTILIGELAKILKQNGVPNMGQNRLFERLRNERYLISRAGTDYNMPTQKSMELGLFAIKETTITHSDGHTTISKTVKVTGKGQIYFVNHFLPEPAAPVAEASP